MLATRHHPQAIRVTPEQRARRLAWRRVIKKLLRAALFTAGTIFGVILGWVLLVLWMA